MKQPANAKVQAIVDNAGRLVQDAELLYENWRHASALVLAIYAVEELGKASLVIWKDLNETVEKRTLWHQQKQSVLGSLYSAYVAAASASEVLRRLGVDDRQANPQFLHPFIDALKTHPDTAPFAEAVFEAVVDIAAEGFSTDKNARLMQDASLGNIERLKRSALYIDLPRTGTGPGEVTREIAGEWVTHARFFYNWRRGSDDGHYPVVLPDASFDKLFGELKAILATKRIEKAASGYRYVDVQMSSSLDLTRVQRP